MFAVCFNLTFNKLSIIYHKNWQIEERNFSKTFTRDKTFIINCNRFPNNPAIKRYGRFIEGLMPESCYFITLNNLSRCYKSNRREKREYLKSFNAWQKLFLSIAIESKIILLYAVNQNYANERLIRWFLYHSA